MGIVFVEINPMKKNIRTFLCFVFVLLGLEILHAQTPSTFVNHRVKKGETEADILQTYGISAAQLYEYNPMVEKLGVKRRMTIRIPVFDYEIKNEVKSASIDTPTLDEFIYHDVLPKETKWRLAYQYGITIDRLNELNPEIQEVLKIGQRIKIPKVESLRLLPEKDTLYNYYKVLPKEGYYRIEKKLGVRKEVLDSLNPELIEKGLQSGMILKIPAGKSGRLNIKDDLLIERINLLDSTYNRTKIKMGVLLPFKLAEIELDSIEETKILLEARNLHTLSLDFYSGVLFAAETLAKSGVEVELNVFDTENKTEKINQLVQNHSLSALDVILGPLIPTNFDFLSGQNELRNIPKVAPLSTNPVLLRKNVYQSVTQKEDFRRRMLTFLESQIDPTDRVVIVADKENRNIEWELKQKFPWAVTLRPEEGDYISPELFDSMMVDSFSNKIIFETQSFPLIASAISQFNAQKTGKRKVQVFTTYRSNVYDNENVSQKMLGGISFTYPAGFKPLESEADADFIQSYINRFGNLPNKEAIRGYDVALDIMLRIAVAGSLEDSLPLGETSYQSNRFFYRKHENESFVNVGLYILTHKGYEILEVKE